MNPIELEWLHLKRDGISGRMFVSEDDLAFSLELALNFRYDDKGFNTFCFNFSFA